MLEFLIFFFVVIALIGQILTFLLIPVLAGILLWNVIQTARGKD